MPKLLMAALLIIALLAGCGQVMVFGHTIGESGATAEAKSASPGATTAIEMKKVKAVTLTLTPQATAKVASDARFDANALLAAIKSELQLRNVLDDTGASTNDIAAISIDDFAMRPTSNAILFGNILSNGSLNGDLQVRDERGAALLSRRMEAQFQLAIPANGESKNPLGPLYQRFAVLVGNHLAGAPAKSEPVLDQRPR